MKNIVLIVLIFAALLFLAPLLWNGIFPKGSISASADYPAPEVFRLQLVEKDEVIEIEAADYLTGCLWAQIPPGYHLEALKAQAAASFTYALRLSMGNRSADALQGADLSNDNVTNQPFFTEERARAHYGAEYDMYYDKIRQAAEYGAGRVLTFANEPIYAVYHGVSAGATNTAQNVWGISFPYLQSVSSDWDKEFINYLCTNEYTVLDVRDSLLAFDNDIIMPLDYGKWFTDYTADRAGYIMAVSARNLTLSGGDLWRILNLRSAAFVIEYTGEVFKVTTKGHGHGVGLSQFGADYMAQKGYNAEEILNHYYTDIIIRDVKKPNQ